MREARRHASHLLTSVLACCLIFRAFNAVVVRTFFNADEFWQGPEIAHKIVPSPFSTRPATPTLCVAYGGTSDGPSPSQLT